MPKDPLRGWCGRFLAAVLVNRRMTSVGASIHVAVNFDLQREQIMDLIDHLIARLGLSEAQAMGGAGIVFRVARRKLSSDQFAQIAREVSGLDDIIASAPDPVDGELTGGISAMLSELRETGQVGELAGLVGDFERLDIDAGRVNRLVSLVVGFVRGRGGDDVGNLLDGVLSSAGKRPMVDLRSPVDGWRPRR